MKPTSQPMLLEVERDLSRARNVAVKAFKRTYCKSDEPYELIAGYCRILEETQRSTFGHTEREAIKNLCADNQIPCNL